MTAITKMTSAMAVLRFFRRCSGVMCNALLDNGWRYKSMERCGRRYGPFQTGGAFPGVGSCGFAAAIPGPDSKEQEDKLREAEEEGADGGDFVEVGELRRVISVATWHTGQPQEVHGEERDVERDHAGPEVPFAQLFAVHVARPLG